MEGYRGHRVVYLSGDGQKMMFEIGHPLNEYAHDVEDPFTDRGIFRANPKVEFPIGRRRWAVSHTYLAYPITDGAMYDKEYTWDAQAQTLTTHFHQHVRLEPARTDGSGLRVEVQHRPISTGVYVRANRHTHRNTSAVRGVWDNPDKQGCNYYIRRAVILTGPQLICYFRSHHQPIVNQLGIWEADDAEQPERFFDAQGHCTSPQGLIEQLQIPLHEPKILAGYCRLEPTDTGFCDFEARMKATNTTSLLDDMAAVPPPHYIEPFIGSRFLPDFAGYAGTEPGRGTPDQVAIGSGYAGYRDIDSDGCIGEPEREFLRQHQGEVWRANVGDYGYFGVGWLSPGYGLSITPERPYHRYIAAYDYGGGYDPELGVINLLESPGPNRDVWIEYHYDAPAGPGEDNIKVYLHV
jgi:hypothetical protein